MLGKIAAALSSTYSPLFFLSLGIASTCLTVGTVFATPINRGTFVGDTVIYVDVTEDSATDPSLITPGPLGGLFGEPTIAGDSLDFNPKNFAAFASGAGGTDHTDANLQFMVEAKPGKGISGLGLSEAGDTTIAGFTNDAFTAVTATIFVEINELNGVAISPINVPGTSMTFTPSAGDYQLSVDGSGPGSYTFAFSGSVFIDLGPYVPFGATATKISVSLDNTLVALSEAGTTAFIQKKDFDGISVTIDTFNVPEPATISLCLLIAGALSVTRRLA